MSIVDPRRAVPEAERRRLLDVALDLAGVCAGVIERCLAGGIRVDAKPDRSLVTTADLAAEEAFRERVERDFPDMGVIGEEFGRTRPEASWQWVIDPVDGTAELANGLPLWGSIIGLFLDGEPVVGVIDHPALALRVHAAFGLGAWANGERARLADLADGVRGGERFGMPSRSTFVRRADEGHVFEAITRAHPNFRVFHTCLTHSCAVLGRLDAAMEWDAPIWDLGATRIVVEEAGGRYACVRERDHPDAGTLYSAVFGRPAMVESVAAVIAGQIPR